MLMEILRFTFDGFWHFWGVVLLLILVAACVPRPSFKWTRKTVTSRPTPTEPRRG